MFPFLVVFAPTLLLGYLPDSVPSRELLVSSFDNVFRPLYLLVSVYNIEVVLVREYDPVEIGQEPLRDREVAFESSRLFIRIEGSGLPDYVNLRRLKATKDDSVRPREYTFGSIEAQAMCFS